MALTSGTRLGPYEILSPLGAGGMGEVYRARDARLSRSVAFKVLPESLSAEKKRLQRFEKEARAASALNHPNIVTIYEVGSSDGTSYIAMELVEGRTLRELIRTGSLPLRRLLPLAVQLADGLARAHEAGIVHRDLKPENVMVTKDGLVKILDFGLAKLTQAGEEGEAEGQLPTMTRATEPGTILGTVGYMSPEQASGGLLDFRSDQFSFGSILYEMATGKRAFERATEVQTLSAIINEEPEAIGELNAQTPAPLRWIVDRCLCKEPEGRYASTRDLARELATIRDHLSEAPVSAASPARSKAGFSGGIRAAVLALAFLATLAVGIFAGLPVWKARSPHPPTVRQVTFRRTGILRARFAPDGQIVYSAIVPDNSPGNPGELFVTRPGAFESRPLGLPPADIASISSGGDLAILLGTPSRAFTLATVPLSGGAPRELVASARNATWSPDGKGLAVVHIAEDRKWRLEYPIGKVLYEIGEPGFIRSPRFSPKGEWIAFKDPAGLKVVDLGGRPRKLAASAATPLGAWKPTDLHWSPGGEEIWFNTFREGATTIEAVTLSGQRRELASFPGDFVFQDVDRAGRLLLERATEENEMVFGRLGDPVESNLTWLDQSIPAVISEDGKTILFTELGRGGGPNHAVYLRRTDAASAVRLGEGSANDLSPDGKWALVEPGSGADQLVLLPTRAGQPRGLPLPGIKVAGGGLFLPDGKRILIRGSEQGHDARFYVLDLETGKTRAVTPEGVPAGSWKLSADGRRVAFFSGDDGKKLLYDLEGGEPRPIAMPEDLYPIKWCSDGRLFVRTHGVHPLKVFRLEISSGRLELWKEFSVSDIVAGLVGVLPTSDGKAYVYRYKRFFSDLFIAEGLR